LLKEPATQTQTWRKKGSHARRKRQATANLLFDAAQQPLELPAMQPSAQDAATEHANSPVVLLGESSRRAQWRF